MEPTEKKKRSILDDVEDLTNLAEDFNAVFDEFDF